MGNENLNEPNSDPSSEKLSRQPQETAPLDNQETEHPTKERISEIQQSNLEGIFYREGPIPDPVTLREYDAVVPGFAKEFLGSFLKESEHRREMESRALRLEEETLCVQEKVITKNQERSNRGLLAGFVISMTALIIGGGLVIAGHNTAGAIIAGPALPSLAAVFVTGVLRKQKEDQDEDSDKDSSALSTKQAEEDSEDKE